MKPDCIVEECSNPQHGRQLCRSHYMRWWRYGDVNTIKRVSYDTVEDRFWAQVDVKSEDECWNWKTSLDTAGYGRIKIVGISTAVGAHVFSYKLKHGDYPKRGPEGINTVDHLCRNPKCVNPNHLELVPHRENNLRGVGAAAQNSRKTHCPQGHEYNSSNTYIQNNGARRCKACLLERQRKRRARRRESIES